MYLFSQKHLILKLAWLCLKKTVWLKWAAPHCAVSILHHGHGGSNHILMWQYLLECSWLRGVCFVENWFIGMLLQFSIITVIDVFGGSSQQLVCSVALDIIPWQVCGRVTAGQFLARKKKMGREESLGPTVSFEGTPEWPKDVLHFYRPARRTMPVTHGL